MKLLTLARDLQRRKARERQSLFVAEGIRTVEELLRSPLLIRGALATQQLCDSSRGTALLEQLHQRGILTEEVGAEEFSSAAETESPQGILAIGVVPKHTLDDLSPTSSVRLLVLEAIQDPGNAGTILRTAAALGATATFSLPGTVDLWNAKVVRSGMGAHFHHLCLSGTWDDLESFRRKHAITLWAADASGESIDALVPPPRLALIVGNEGGGLSSLSRTRADRLVALPIAASTDSLNVAVAAGILLYELRADQS
jgi:RNA methyltransferase, TrmH family